jgi:predicted Zn-dependent protease with MMP-like domain
VSPYALTEEECRTAVEGALDELPDWIRRRLGDVAVIVEDSHPRHLMGVYDPRGGLHRIVIFRDANPNVEEVRRTVLHEVGHHFGMNEQQLREAGYG